MRAHHSASASSTRGCARTSRASREAELSWQAPKVPAYAILRRAVPDFLVHWIATYGLGAIFGLLFLGVFGLPVPDETLLTFAGVLVRQGRLPLIPTFFAAWL